MTSRHMPHDARATAPTIGAWVPMVTLSVTYVALAVGVCFVVVGSPFWRVVGLLLAVTGTLAPRAVPTWWLLLVLGLSQLWRTPSAHDVTFYVLLASVHLLHVLGSYLRLFPRHARLQMAALVGPLRRYVLVQAVVQPLAVGVLSAFAGGARGVRGAGGVPGLSIAAAAALAVVAALLARGLWMARRRVM